MLIRRHLVSTNVSGFQILGCAQGVSSTDRHSNVTSYQLDSTCINQLNQ